MRNRTSARPPCLLPCRLAPFFLSALRRFRRSGDPSRAQLRNPANELHRNRFGKWEMHRPLSQLIPPELIFERREERSRCGKQRIVFLEAGEIEHRLSVQLVSGHAISDALHRVRNGPPLLIASRTCSSFGRTASGCAAMYSSTDLGTLCFIHLILCFGSGSSSPELVPRASFGPGGQWHRRTLEGVRVREYFGAGRNVRRTGPLVVPDRCLSQL